MRGRDRRQAAMWSYLSPEDHVAKDHPLRTILVFVDRALAELDPLFRRMYARRGRPSIPPERLLRALVLQLLYSIRSERLLMEQLDHDLLFRWFVGLTADEPVWDPTVFTHNRQRLLDQDVARAFLAAVLAQARAADLLSDEHFTVDGTQIEAWASQKSFRPIDPTGPQGQGGAPGSPGDFKGQRRSNRTHRSTTDAEARLYRKGNSHPARLSYLGHVLAENKSGLAVGGMVTAATGWAEREAALALAEEVPRGATLGADRAYDTADFVAALRARGITAHVAQNTTHRRSAIDRRTTRHPGYAMSQTARRLRESVNGWLKTIGLQRQTHLRGRRRVDWHFVFALGVYDLVRLRSLRPQVA